jgi:hypothetical protein
MGSSDDIGSSLVNRRVNHKCCTVDWHGAMNDFSVMVDQKQITDAHVTKAQAKWVDPKVISEFGVADGDMSCDSFAKSHATENAQGTSEA